MRYKRMQFAWARGAEFYSLYESLVHAPFNNSVIAESDAHLQYGPLSTALRAYATKENVPAWTVQAADETVVALSCDVAPFGWWDNEMSPKERLLYRLFMAEYLADEGM